MIDKSEFKTTFFLLLKSPAFFSVIAVSASLWLIDPAYLASLTQDGGVIAQSFDPAGNAQHILELLSMVIAVLGTSCCFLFLLLNNLYKRFIREKQLLKSIVESEPECVKTVSSDGCLLSMNPAGLKLIEADSFDCVAGQPVLDLIAPEHRSRFKQFHEDIISGNAKQLQFDLIGLKGTRKTMETHAVPLYDSEQKKTVHLAITRDITQSKILSNKLQYQASHDLLTGLVNRNEFETRLQHSLQRARADACTHAVFFMDLDQFKLINDSCGHLAGDNLLKRTAEILRAQLRAQDTVARLGGDEFAVLLEYCSENEAEELANRLREKIEMDDFFWQQRSFKYTSSIGVVMIDDTTPNVAEVLSTADAACYIAKDRGRNRVYVLKQDDDATLKKRNEMQWVAKINEGIRDARFSLYAQRIQGLNSQSGEHHAEILIRYQDDSGDMVPPGAFLPAAERYGTMCNLDRYVIQSTLCYLNANPTLLTQIDTFCINLSGQSLADEKFLEFVVSQLANNASLARHLVFEITETAAISNMTSANLFISQVKKFGCRFSLDDFGSGLSSFAYLKNLPVDYVKIDGEFVKDITHDSLDLAMIRSINEIAHLLGKQTVAEFVESEEIKTLLIDLGVDYAQGYSIHKPEPLDALRDATLGDTVQPIQRAS